LIAGNLGRTIWIVDAHRDDGRRFVVHADERLTAFLELEKVASQPLHSPTPEKLAKRLIGRLQINNDSARVSND
jgi:hypothetical protein